MSSGDGGVLHKDPAYAGRYDSGVAWAILSDAEAGSPDEICGLVLWHGVGCPDSLSGHEWRRGVNVHRSPEHSYELDSDTVLIAFAHCELSVPDWHPTDQQSCRIDTAIHSHPRGEFAPSNVDEDSMVGGYTYGIALPTLGQVSLWSQSYNGELRSLGVVGADGVWVTP